MTLRRLGLDDEQLERERESTQLDILNELIALRQIIAMTYEVDVDKEERN